MGGGGGGRFYGTIAATCRSKEKDTILYMELSILTSKGPRSA